MPRHSNRVIGQLRQGPDPPADGVNCLYLSISDGLCRTITGIRSNLCGDNEGSR
jgi:hypothetical protein